MTPTEIRRDLHRHPELSGSESRTHDIVVRELRLAGATEIHEHVGSNPDQQAYGVVACFGNPDAPAIAFRADMDALPIADEIAAPYVSVIPSVGHKCGHDGHTAILLQLAHSLRNSTATVVLIFQPEEETGNGSKRILDSGVLRRYHIREIYAIHNLPGFPSNQVVMIRNTFAAASSGLIVNLKGRKTHASTPELGINPGMAVSELITRFQRLVHPNVHEVKQFSQSTLIHVRLGEEAYGTSAGDATMAFTLRAFTNETMEWLLSTARTIVREVAQAHQLQYSIELCEPFHAAENHEHQWQRVLRVAESTMRNITEVERPFRWSEDFADFLIAYPGAMFGIGAGVDHVELHHPQYDFPDEIIEPTASLFLSLVADFARNIN